MLKRPSSRRRSSQTEIAINLVPILDALVTLITFMLFTTTFLAITVLDTPTPLLAPPEEQVEKIQKQPLQLTAFIQPDKILISDWTGSREKHSIANITDPETNESRYDFEKFHQTLIEIKQRHSNETKLVLKPDPGVAYEVLISIMDAARSIEKTDPPLYKKSAQGIDEPELKLFPEVIFGNLMS